MTATLRGPIDMRLKRDKDYYKDYSLSWLIETDDILDGPHQVINCAGLPNVGTEWTIGNDNDIWCWCTPECNVNPVFGGSDQDTVRFWTLDQIFTNRPQNRCQTTEIEEPWLEPARVGGSFIKYTKEVRFDRHGNLIKSSSHEPITGPDVEFDANKPTVNIEITSLTLPLGTVTSMVDTVNDDTLWGLTARKIKLSNVYWRRHLYGVCTYYYVIGMEFDVDFDTFDRKVLDVGTRHLDPNLVGHWPQGQVNPATNQIYTPDDLVSSWKIPGGATINYAPPVRIRDIPSNFTKITDAHENPMGFMILNGKGQIWPGPESGVPPGEVDIEYYPESDFTLLGVPLTLGT